MPGVKDRNRFTIGERPVEASILRSDDYDHEVYLTSREETYEVGVDSEVAHVRTTAVPEWVVASLRRLGVADVVDRSRGALDRGRA